MPLDLQILSSDANGNLGFDAWPRPSFVDGEYALIQRVIHCLHTDLGDDSFDPGYGASLRLRIAGISGNDLEAASAAVRDALDKVLEDLTQTPVARTPDGTLKGLNLVLLTFDPGDTTWRAQITVATSENETTILTLLGSDG